MGSRTHSAGTSEIARDSGGDSLPVDDASALETTLARLRQRYSLYFRVPNGAKPKEERTISVELADATRRRYPDAEVRYRRGYRTPTEIADNTGVTVIPAASTSEQPPPADVASPAQKRRRMVDGSGASDGPNPSVAAPVATAPATTTPATTEVKPAADPKATTQTETEPPKRWRRVGVDEH
jgi:hypothetical protein